MKFPAYQQLTKWLPRLHVHAVPSGLIIHGFRWNTLFMFLRLLLPCQLLKLLLLLWFPSCCLLLKRLPPCCLKCRCNRKHINQQCGLYCHNRCIAYCVVPLATFRFKVSVSSAITGKNAKLPSLVLLVIVKFVTAIVNSLYLVIFLPILAFFLYRKKKKKRTTTTTHHHTNRYSKQQYGTTASCLSAMVPQ